MSNPKVLHVTESFGGGVASAIVQYTSTLPGIKHHLLAAIRGEDFKNSDELEHFDSVRTLSRNPIQAILQIRRTVQKLDPAIIHAHSSFGGVYTRLAIRSTAMRPIVYTPHGYSFERQDIGVFKRSCFRIVEHLLAFNTRTIASCSPRESDLSRKFRSRVIYVPNSVDMKSAGSTRKFSKTGILRVVSLGRITAARNPEFYLEVAQGVSQCESINLTWIGSGDSGYISKFNVLGVGVTGWLPRDEALLNLMQSDILFHCSSWDGFPMAVLEASSLGIPVITTDIPTFSHLADEVKFETAAQVVQFLKSVASDRQLLDEIRAYWQKVLCDHTPEAQRKALLKAYEFPFELEESFK